MATFKSQPYPRVQDENSDENNLIDLSQLGEHVRKIDQATMSKIIREAVGKANQKSSRKSIDVPAGATPEERDRVYQKSGRDLFRYFKRYCDDPASTAHHIHGKHYREVAIEQFHNRHLQKGRMNSGWRYQFLLFDCANESHRFKNVSDIGLVEADFNAVLEQLDKGKPPITFYVSVKNRKNTLGGQDWPKAIRALEGIANSDKNRTGPYCCVFAITMDRGKRYAKVEQKTQQLFSSNSEIWLSDLVWPFFANYSYEEIMMLVLDALSELETSEEMIVSDELPEKVLESFGDSCRKANLVDENGYFNDPHQLVRFFCN